MMKARELSGSEFEHFAQQHSLQNLWQSPMMAAMQKDCGKTTAYVGVCDAKCPEELIGACLFIYEPAHFGMRLARSPRGPLIRRSDEETMTAVLQAFVSYLKTKNILYWRADPYFPYQQRDLQGSPVGTADKTVIDAFVQAGFHHDGFSVGLDPTKEPRWMHVVRVDGHEPLDLLDQFSRKARRNIKAAQDMNVQIHELDKANLGIVDRILEETSRRKGFIWRDADYHRRLYRSFALDGAMKFLCASIDLKPYRSRLEADRSEALSMLRDTEQHLLQISSKKMLNRKAALEDKIRALEKKIDHARILADKDDGHQIMLAAGLFFTYGDEVLCLMSGESEGTEEFFGLYALHWHMIRYCLEHHKNRYNFYGISGDFSPDAQDAGVFSYKKGSGGEVIELPGVFERPISRGRYIAYRLLKKVRHIL